MLVGPYGMLSKGVKKNFSAKQQNFPESKQSGSPKILIKVWADKNCSSDSFSTRYPRDNKGSAECFQTLHLFKWLTRSPLKYEAHGSISWTIEALDIVSTFLRRNFVIPKHWRGVGPRKLVTRFNMTHEKHSYLPLSMYLFPNQLLTILWRHNTVTKISKRSALDWSTSSTNWICN